MISLAKIKLENYMTPLNTASKPSRTKSRLASALGRLLTSAAAIPVALAGSLMMAFTAPTAMAQAWPIKPVRIVLHFPTGGSTDAVARILAQSMAQSLGQPVIIDNKPGADGAIAGDFVARAEPDGHTFFLATNTAMMQVPLLKKTLPTTR